MYQFLCELDCVSTLSSSSRFFISYLADKSSGIELSFREARRFDWEELCTATKNFNEQGLIGVGKFGEVYKGLLTDGMLVAIKKRAVAPTTEFVEEVMFVP